MAKSQSNRLDWLDALRGWAVFGVLMVHSGQVAHCTGIEQKVSAAGQYGVQLFFLVSALTISMTYESHIAQFGRSVRSQFAWFIKRFFRIAPLYYFAVLFYSIERYAMYRFSHHHYGSTTHALDIIANVLFVHAWTPSANNAVVPGGWSIGVEMFFYTLVPFCWLVVSIRRRITMLGVCAVVFLGVTLLVSKLWTGTFLVEDSTFLYYWFPTQAPAIIVGLIFYCIHGPKLHAQPTPKFAAACAGAFLICLAIGVFLGTWREIAPVLSPTIVAISFVFLILSLRGQWKNLVVNKYSIFLGKVSFSVYIFHFVILDGILTCIQVIHLNRSGPLTIFPIFAITIAGTSGIALISKHLIEDPGIAYGHKLSRSIAIGSDALLSGTR